MATIQHWSLFDDAQHTCARHTPGRGWPGSAVEECKLAVLSTGLGTSWNADALAGRRAGTSVRHAALPFCDAAAASGKAAAVAVTRSVAVWAVNRGRGCSDVSPGEPASSLHAWRSPSVCARYETKSGAVAVALEVGATLVDCKCHAESLQSLDKCLHALSTGVHADCSGHDHSSTQVELVRTCPRACCCLWTRRMRLISCP